MSSTEALYLVFLSSGFTVGFGHCIGMCGPIVVSLSLNVRAKGALIPHVLYNAGRVNTYALLGAVMGATGSFTGVAGSLVGIQKGVMIFAGVVIVIMGLAMAGWVPAGKVFGDYFPTAGIFATLLRWASATRSSLAYYPLGLILGLLPCGPVYTALVATARAGMEAGSPIEGSLMGLGLMLAFGVGTVPALLLVAKLSGLSWLHKRQAIYKIASFLMVLVGLYFIIKGIRY